MERIKSCDLDINITVRPIQSKNGSLIYQTNNHQVVKVFSEKTLKENSSLLEEKLSNPRNIKGVIMPRDLVYIHDNLIGYTMDKVEGKVSEEYEKSISPYSRVNLLRLAYKYLELEKIVKEAGDDVVFPELLDKVFIDKADGIKVIGYDSIQVGNSEPIRKTITPSSLDKYNNNGLYTKELDIKSLTLYYVRTVLDLDLRALEEKDDEQTLHYISRVLDTLCLPEQLKEKIRTLYEKDKKNEYLGKDVLEIAEKYKVDIDENCIYPTNKRLVLK